MMFNFKERSWTVEEDDQLSCLVEKSLKKKCQYDRFTRTKELTLSFNWTCIATNMLTRSHRECKERFLTVISPETDLLPWTKEENELLVILKESLVTDVDKLSSFFPGRREYNFVPKETKPELVSKENETKTNWVDDFVDDILSQTDENDHLKPTDLQTSTPTDFDNFISDLDGVFESSNSFSHEDIFDDLLIPTPPPIQRQSSIMCY